jgi:hypothetical protein
LAQPSLAADLLILAGGERRAGALASCDAERCFFEQAPVPLADVVWIGLGVEEGEPPRGVTTPGAVLLDGAVTAGRLVGISLGTVALDAAELERSAVRWVRVSEGQPPVDVLMLRRGGVRTGGLQGCAGATCTMAGQATALADLLWIGLGAEPELTSPPAQPADPARDAIELADGTVRATTLVGVNAGDVVSSDGRFPRRDVVWIYVAPRAGEGPGGVRYRPSPPDPPAPGPPRRPEPQPPGSPPAPEPPPPPSPPTPPTRPGSPSCDARLGQVRGSGVMWTGTARVVESMRGPGWLNKDTADFDVKLRESCEVPVFDLSVTPRRRVGTVIYLDASGTVQRDTRIEQSSTDLCEGQGTHTEPAGIAGEIWRRSGAGNTARSLGFDLPSQPAYSLRVGGNTSEIVEAPCRGEYWVGISSRSFFGFNAGRHPSSASGWDSDLLRSPSGGIMRGIYSKALGPMTRDVAWSICRAGVQCPPLPEPEAPPELPPTDDEEEPPSDCDETRADRVQLDLKMDQMNRLLRSLKNAREAHDRIAAESTQWAGDYEFAMRQCNLWNAAQFLVGLLATGGGSALNPVLGRGTGFTGPVAEIQATKQFWNFLSMLEKVESGDPSWLLPNHEFKAAFGLSIEDAWDGFLIGYGQLGPSSPDLLRQGLEDCAVANIDEVMDGAKKYLSLIEQVKPLAERMNRVVNDVRDKDEDIFDFCLGRPKACEDYERCR